MGAVDHKKHKVVRVKWQDRAACQGWDTNIFFPERGQPTSQAKRICAECPVTRECLQWAEDTLTFHGVFGGLSANERERIRRNKERTRVA